MSQVESGIELFKVLHDQLIATQDPRDAERAGIVDEMLKARKCDLTYNPQDDLMGLLGKRGMAITVGVSPKPPIHEESKLEDREQLLSTAPNRALDELELRLQELSEQTRLARLDILFRPHCKEPEEFEACRKLMDMEDMTGWEVWTALRIIQTNDLPVFFVPSEWLKK